MAVIHGPHKQHYIEFKSLKVGDRVRIRSLEWFNSHLSEDGHIVIPSRIDHDTFTLEMASVCGKEAVVIEKITRVLAFYEIIKLSFPPDVQQDDLDPDWYDWHDWMLEGVPEP